MTAPFTPEQIEHLAVEVDQQLLAARRAASQTKDTRSFGVDATIRNLTMDLRYRVPSYAGSIICPLQTCRLPMT